MAKNKNTDTAPLLYHDTPESGRGRSKGRVGKVTLGVGGVAITLAFAGGTVHEMHESPRASAQHTVVDDHIVGGSTETAPLPEVSPDLKDVMDVTAETYASRALALTKETGFDQGSQDGTSLKEDFTVSAGSLVGEGMGTYRFGVTGTPDAAGNIDPASVSQLTITEGSGLDVLY